MELFTKSIRHLLVLLFLSGVGLSVQASDSGISTQAYQVQLKAYTASTSFHMYTLLEGDRQIRDDIANVTLQIQEQIDVWESEGVISGAQSILESSARFLHLVQANEIAEEGYTSTYTVNDMEAALDDFLADLDLLQPEAKKESLQTDILKSTVLIRKIGSRYARLAAHWNARAGILADAEGDTIDVHTQTVTKQLNAISSRTDLSAETKKIINLVIKKWRFISPKLMDYQNDTVPYLVARYSSSIVNQMLEVP